MVAVFGLRHVFPDEVMRRVAVIAGGDCVMSGLLPAVVLFAHDVTVDAGFRIVGEIRKTLSIVKRVATHAGKKSKRRSQNQTEDDAGFIDGRRHRETLRSGCLIAVGVQRPVRADIELRQDLRG